MTRSDFLKLLCVSPLSYYAMKLNSLNTLSNNLPIVSEMMPVLFLGHGSPMNAIEENEFVRGFREIGKTIPKPKVILVVSAHWETKGTFVTAMEHPRTIHDFGGFPKALFDVQYPAPGSPELANEIKNTLHTTSVGLDDKWGLDHGAWTVVKHLYPQADIPVIQMSIDYSKDASYHYQLSKELLVLRNKGVLIIGSGNIVHNLSMLAWDKLQVENYAYDWALEASEKIKSYIQSHNHQALIDYKKQGKAFDLSIPSPEHYIPLIYTLALQTQKDTLQLFNDKAMAGSLTMTSLKIG